PSGEPAAAPTPAAEPLCLHDALPSSCSTARPASMKLAHAINLFLGIIRRCYRRVLRTTTPMARKPPHDESAAGAEQVMAMRVPRERKSTRLNSSHVKSSHAVLCLNKI